MCHRSVRSVEVRGDLRISIGWRRRSSPAIDLDTLLGIECTLVRHKLCAAVSIERLARFDESEPIHFVDKRLIGGSARHGTEEIDLGTFKTYGGAVD